MTRAPDWNRARGSLSAVLGSFLLVAGCGAGEPEAAPTVPSESPSAVETSSPAETASPVETTTSASPTSSATPTIDKPTLPPEAEVQDHTGATAFVYYWWDHFNYAYASGDATGLETISAEVCTFCQSVIDDVEERTRDDLRTEGGEIEVIDAAAPPDDIVDTVYEVTTVVRQNTGHVYEVDGSSAGDIGEDPQISSQALAVWQGGGWVMEIMTLEPSTEG